MKTPETVQKSAPATPTGKKPVSPAPITSIPADRPTLSAIPWRSPQKPTPTPRATPRATKVLFSISTSRLKIVITEVDLVVLAAVTLVVTMLLMIQPLHGTSPSPPPPPIGGYSSIPVIPVIEPYSYRPLDAILGVLPVSPTPVYPTPTPSYYDQEFAPIAHTHTTAY